MYQPEICDSDLLSILQQEAMSPAVVRALSQASNLVAGWGLQSREESLSPARVTHAQICVLGAMLRLRNKFETQARQCASFLANPENLNERAFGLNFAGHRQKPCIDVTIQVNTRGTLELFVLPVARPDEANLSKTADGRVFGDFKRRLSFCANGGPANCLIHLFEYEYYTADFADSAYGEVRDVHKELSKCFRQSLNSLLDTLESVAHVRVQYWVSLTESGRAEVSAVSERICSLLEQRCLQSSRELEQASSTLAAFLSERKVSGVAEYHALQEDSIGKDTTLAKVLTERSGKRTSIVQIRAIGKTLSGITDATFALKETTQLLDSSERWCRNVDQYFGLDF